MKIIYLGQAGLCFETDGKTILVDPYLSNSVAKSQPQNYRRQPVDESFLSMKPDIIVITHNHGDHYDKETLAYYLNEESKVLFLSPLSVWADARKFGGNGNNFVLFNCGSEWTEGDIKFRAVKAEHSDEYAIGVVISAENKHYYITGDTLYNESVFTSLPEMCFEAVFLPVNGKGNNMNFTDAARFVERLEVKRAVPLHVGMFDELTAHDWQCKKKVVPQIYREIEL